VLALTVARASRLSKLGAGLKVVLCLSDGAKWSSC
jgi:hypothetical protein